MNAAMLNPKTTFGGIALLVIVAIDTFLFDVPGISMNMTEAATIAATFIFGTADASKPPTP